MVAMNRAWSEEMAENIAAEKAEQAAMEERAEVGH